MPSAESKRWYMHELGIVFEIVKRVEMVAEENQFEQEDIMTVVVEVGEASTIVPKYLIECWPAAVDRTGMEESKLEVEIIVACVECKKCGEVYEYLNSGKVCPKCGSPECVMVTGQEFNIKEIQVYEENEEET